MTLFAALVVCAACKPSATTKTPFPAVPQTRATVVTIQTTIQPENRTATHSIVIAGDRARSSDELDRWRLFDLKARTVTFVDDIAKTYRTEPLDAILERRAAALSRALPDGIPRAHYSTSSAAKVIQGVSATQASVKAGGYVRELWLGNHPAIPPTLFPMMLASDEPVSPLAPMMRDADAALLKVSGFPLADHAELPFLDRKLVVDRSVARIESKNVVASFLAIPAGYKEVVKPPEAGTPPSRPTRRSPRPPNQRTRRESPILLVTP